jgi:phage terminase large subunit-like protein
VAQTLTERWNALQDSSNPLTAEEIVLASRYFWTQTKARSNQLPPDGDWLVWLILSGRGWGKTRTGAEWIAHQAISQPNTRWAIIAPTFSDARDTCVEGESGVQSVLNRYRQIHSWNRSMGELRLRNGSRIKLFSADEPERLRGPQHHGAWCDELAAWRYDEAWDQLMFGLRLGERPQTVVTTTPKPRRLVKSLLSREGVAITRGSTFENEKNLYETALMGLRARYEGTRIGRQELMGELLTDVEGALWTLSMIDELRVEKEPENLIQIVVAIDPAVTANENSDETGIIIAGRDAQGEGYVLADYSMKASPLEWAHRVIDAFDQYEANTVVVEVNNGGDMIPTVLRQVRPTLPIKEVRATRGKKLRAEPIAAMYEQGRIHHVGVFEKLEDQMTTWTVDDPKSPDRLDALVWAMTSLLDTSPLSGYLSSLAHWCNTCSLPMPKNLQVCSNCASPLSESGDTRHVLGV